MPSQRLVFQEDEQLRFPVVLQPQGKEAVYAEEQHKSTSRKRSALRGRHLTIRADCGGRYDKTGDHGKWLYCAQGSVTETVKNVVR